MARFIIQGGKKLSGEITPAGNKNAALPMLAACLLTDEPVTLRNLPRIRDVEVMLELLEGLGVGITRRKSSVVLQAAGLRSARPDPALCRRVRGSILLAGPLIARFKKAELGFPGGDVIGRRRLDAHFLGFEQFGVSVEASESYHFRRTRLKAADILLEEASVTATENLAMCAVLATGTTTLYNAACEPHVQDLCALLNRMGARIEGAGTNLITIRGVKRLHGASHRIQADYIEAGSFLAAAAATGGSLSVRGMDQPGLFPVICKGFARCGAPLIQEGRTWRVGPGRKIVAQGLEPAVPKLEDGIWPAFPSDLLSVMIVLATQAKGSILFYEKLFESRLYFVDRLIEMGGHLVQCDPHRVMAVGPSRLSGARLTSPDIRAGMALIIAALCARGESIIENAEMVDRGYERIEERLRALGARIERVD